MKKIFNIIFSLVCCLIIFSTPIINMLPVMAKDDGTTYINKDDITERNIKVISNIVGDTSIILYEYQSHFYITMDTVKELTGLSTSVSTGNGIFSATVTDGIRTVYVNLEDRTISDEIDGKVVKDSSGKEIVNDINAMLYNNEFLVEAVPFLRYLGASVEYINGYFICSMNENSIWSVLPNWMEGADEFLFPFTTYIPDYEKRLTLDIIVDYIFGGNLIIFAENTMNNYYKEAIYDMFEVNPYSYDSVKKQEERNVQKEKNFLDSKQLLDLGDQLKDVGVDTAKILEDLYLTSEIDWLDFKWNGAYKLGFTEEASKISKELNMKTVKLYEDTIDGGNIDKAGYAVSALVYGAKIYSDYNKVNNYDNDTAYCLAAEVNSMKYAYSDTSSIGWLQIADKVSQDVLDSRNNARNAILDNTIELMQGEGSDLIISAASGTLLLSMKAATFLTNIICNDIIEAEHHEIITILQQDMQYQSYNLCCELWKKAESENFSNTETVIRFVDSLKFFYRFSMAYYNSIQQWGEHYYPNEDWKTPFQNRNDAMALKFYNLLNAKMTPNKDLFNYEALKDDEFSESAFQESASETIDYEEIYYSYIENELVPKYGTCSNYKDVLNMVDYQVDLSLFPSGLLNYSISDFNNDNTKELLVSYCTNRLDEYEQQYHTISLQLYTIDSSKQVVLSDEIATSLLSGYYTNYFYKLFTAKNTNNEKFICSFEKYSVNGISSMLAICKVDNDCKFKLCDILIDPGYTSAVGLYHSNSLQANQIYECRYSDCEEIYEVDFSNDERFDISIFYGLINDIIGSYGISAYSVNDYNDYDISAENEDQILNVDYQRNFENNTATINITTNAVLQKEILSTSTTSWQQLYADELRNFMNSNDYYEDTMFELMDIDNNNIPELFISEGAPHMRQVQVYTIYNGKLIFLGDYGEYGYVSYNSTKSLMWSGYFNQGYGFESHYRLENGTLIKVFSCETNSAAVMDESEVYYIINGENVTQSVYDAKREENTFDGWVSVGRKYSLDESTINSVILF